MLLRKEPESCRDWPYMWASEGAFTNSGVISNPKRIPFYYGPMPEQVGVCIVGAGSHFICKVICSESQPMTRSTLCCVMQVSSGLSMSKKHSGQRIGMAMKPRGTWLERANIQMQGRVSSNPGEVGGGGIKARTFNDRP